MKAKKNICHAEFPISAETSLTQIESNVSEYLRMKKKCFYDDFLKAKKSASIFSEEPLLIGDVDNYTSISWPEDVKCNIIIDNKKVYLISCPSNEHDVASEAVRDAIHHSSGQQPPERKLYSQGSADIRLLNEHGCHCSFDKQPDFSFAVRREDGKMIPAILGEVCFGNGNLGNQISIMEMYLGRFCSAVYGIIVRIYQKRPFRMRILLCRRRTLSQRLSYKESAKTISDFLKNFPAQCSKPRAFQSSYAVEQLSVQEIMKLYEIDIVSDVTITSANQEIRFVFEASLLFPGAQGFLDAVVDHYDLISIIEWHNQNFSE